MNHPYTYATARICLIILAVAGLQPVVAQQPGSFQTVVRPGAVELDKEYNLAGLSIPVEQIHRLLPKDAIPALTDPKREQVGNAKWLKPDARIMVVEVGSDVLGVPLQILDQHEIVNTTLGGDPIAITYCPLCDSATVFNRTIKDKGGQESTLEFGVSGALFNSNVLMYDRKTRGLWSQLGMQAVSGPLVGTRLQMLPVNLVTFSEFAKNHPQAEVVSRDTGHNRDYSRSVYGQYFVTDKLMVPVFSHGGELPRKTLGIGIATDEQAWFVPADQIEGVRNVETPLGTVSLAKSAAGIQVPSLPEGVRVAQTFYYSWSAFYPDTKIVTK